MKIKYYGRANVRRLSAGENWNGLLAEPLAADLEWGPDNNWIVDTDEAGLSEAVVTLLLGDPAFIDVTEEEIVPVNEAQHFIGMVDPEGVESRAAVSTEESEEAQQRRLDAQAARANGGVVSESGSEVTPVDGQSGGQSLTAPAGTVTPDVGGSGDDSATGSTGGGRRGSRS